MTATRLKKKDQPTLNPGTLIAKTERYQLWQGRDIVKNYGRTRYLKTDCWVVQDLRDGFETYWHGKNRQKRNEEQARYLFETWAKSSP